MASLTTRDEWVRARWSGWLKRCLDFEGVTVNSLSRHLARNTMGDYRGTIKSYCRGETTVTAERAFEIGEAVATLAPCGWVSGPLAVAAAGYYEDVIGFLEAFETLQHADSDGGAALAALHVPFLAEFEIAAISDKLPIMMSAADDVCANDETRRFLKRILRNAFWFHARANTLRHIYAQMRATQVEETLEAEIFPVVAAWRTHLEPPDARDLDEFALDRRTLLAIARRIASGFSTELDPHRLNAVLLDLIWQWLSLVNFSPTQTDRYELDILRQYFKMHAEVRHLERHADKYIYEELIPGMFAPIPLSNERLRAVPLGERVDDIRRYDAALRRFKLLRLRVSQRATHKEPYHSLVKAHHDRFANGIASPGQGDSEAQSSASG